MYPIVEIVHIVGFVILVGAAVMFDLRVLGLGRGLAVTALARHLLRWSWAGLGLVVPAGLMMFTAHATEFGTNPAFQLKLALLAAAAANVAFFHARPVPLGAGAGTSRAGTGRRPVCRRVVDRDLDCGDHLRAPDRLLLIRQFGPAPPSIACGERANPPEPPALAFHFTVSTPLTISQRASESSATKIGTKSAGNSVAANAGLRK